MIKIRKKYWLCLILVGALIYGASTIIALQKEVHLLHNQNKFIFKHLSGGIRNIPKAHGELRDRQLKLLKALIAFDKLAKAHQIEYWLDWGTLLGAVRHDGFIPWDDDIDLAMTEDNLQKLQKLTATKEYNISLVPANNNPKQALWFFSNEHGSIDIFSHVYIPKKEYSGQERYTYWMHNLKFLPASYIKEKILDRLDGIKKKPSQENQDDLYIMTRTTKRSGQDTPQKAHFAVEEIFPLKKHVFEGYEFPVPHNSSAVLSRRYSKNYNELPDTFGYSHHMEAW